MSYQVDEVWNDSILIFDSSSILRLYEWYVNKSLQLKDIFDCKTQNIVLLEQVKKETTKIFEQRIDQKKNKYLGAINYFLEQQDKEKALRTFKKECDGYKFPEEFLFLLRNYLDGISSSDEINKYINEKDLKGNLYIDENKLDHLFNEFFSSEYQSTLKQEQIDAKFLIDEEKGLPGYKDKGKDRNSSGDYIILNQLVEIANQEDCSITFITADVKPDWFPYNKKTNKRELNSNVIDWFNVEITKNSKINVITLLEMLEIAQVYISSDINSLVDETIIQNLVEEKYGEWFPPDLMEKVAEYIEEDGDIQLEIEDAIDSTLDNLEFGESEDYDIVNIDYEIDGDEVSVTLYIDFYLSLDASAHWDREDHELGSPSCHFSGIVKGSIPIEWESKDTGAITIGSQLMGIEIESIMFLGADSLYPVESNEYDEPEHDEPEHDEQDEYDEPEYDEQDEYDEPEYDEQDEYEEPEYDELAHDEEDNDD